MPLPPPPPQAVNKHVDKASATATANEFLLVTTVLPVRMEESVPSWTLPPASGDALRFVRRPQEILLNF